jgi:signal transduction histidine kinase
MATAAELLELGDRYWALGLPAAARSALGRALEAGTDAEPALRLTQIALAQGDVRAARAFAAEAAKRQPGPSTKILLGRAQLAAGEATAARMSLLAAIDSPKLAAWDRARAHLELSRAAAGQSDPAGAAAQAGAAFEAALAAAKTSVTHESVTLIEEICAALVAHGRAADATATLDTAPDSRGKRVCVAALLAARQAGGDPVTDAMVEAALGTVDDVQDIELPAGALKLRRIERRVRRHSVADRQQLAREVEHLIETTRGEDMLAADRARLWFLFAALYADEPGTRDRAEDAYRKGLAYQPGNTSAACRLALLVLDRGDQTGALAEIERALRIDASHGMAWRNAARMLDAQSPSLGVIVQRLLDAANPGAGSSAAGVAPRLVTATAEVARHDVLAGVYAHGHRVKNLLGIIGARTRSARKLAEGDVHDRLKDLETDVTALYEEWAQYLRSMQSPTPTIELVPLPSLLHEVVVSAQARTQQVPIALDQQAGLPDVRGDRMLLREALLNIVSNAAEASVATNGNVAVRVRAIAAPTGGTAPIVEIVVADTGPGIPRAHLGRLFVPGFTTKETGSGVGLAIAERVVSAHHGRITVESNEDGDGRGTTITVTLPTDKAGLQSLPLWNLSERT